MSPAQAIDGSADLACWRARAERAEAAAVRLRQENAELNARVAALSAEVGRLQEAVTALSGLLFGTSSEKRAPAARGRSALFAGGAEQQPAQRRDRLLQPAHLGGQRGHPGVQLRIFLPQPHGRRLSPLGPGTPAGQISAAVDRLRGGHASPPHITAVRLSRTKPGVSQIPPHQPGPCAAARPPPAGPATSATRVHRLFTLVITELASPPLPENSLDGLPEERAVHA